MKILLCAIAMTIAVPAAAQTTAPAADPHAGHTMPADHGQHQGSTGHEGHGGCCEQKGADGKKMGCCDKAKAEGGKMECCDKMAKQGSADAHAGHDMSKH